MIMIYSQMQFYDIFYYCWEFKQFKNDKDTENYERIVLDSFNMSSKCFCHPAIVIFYSLIQKKGGGTLAY